MKKTIKVILLTFLTVILNQNLYSQTRFNADFGIVGVSGYNITATVEIVSVPFEGITEPKTGYGEPLNRVGQIQSGSYWRFYSDYINPPLKKNITYISNTQNGDGYVLDLGHCSGGEYPLGKDGRVTNDAWGFAKYKITIIVSTSSTEEIYKLYLNSLDSRYGRYSPYGYIADLLLSYRPNLPLNSRMEFSKTIFPNTTIIGIINTWDVLPNGEPSREFKVWECVHEPGLTEPIAKDFYARTTPFPFSPRLIWDQHIRTLELGTNIEFGDVYNYTGESDRFGYNTIDSASVWYAYFTYPPIFDPEHNNVTGKTFVTPAYFYIDGVNNQEIYGFRLNVLNGNKIKIKNDRRFWISGMQDGYLNFQGDTICFFSGSILEMEANAQLNACRGGKILDYGAIANWNPNSFSHIFEKAELAYLGTSHTVNNGGHIEIDGQATLKVGDNSTVTFDGAGTYLKLNSNSIIQLGTNAKIKFTNGAYLDANGATFAALNSNNTYEGLIFENAGSSSNASTISNCTFNNAITPININNNGSSANNSISITGNTFNLPSSGSQGIHGGNVYNLLVQNNTFNMPSNIIAGLYIQNSGTANAAGNSNVNSYNLNIIGNTFSGGHIGMILNSNTNLIPFYIYGNIFNNNSSYNILARLISGDIKNNSSNINNVNYSFYLVQSHPNLYANNVYASQANIFSCTESYPRLSPCLVLEKVDKINS